MTLLAELLTLLMVCPSVATAVANASVYRLVTMAFSELAEGISIFGASREYSFL